MEVHVPTLPAPPLLPKPSLSQLPLLKVIAFICSFICFGLCSHQTVIPRGHAPCLPCSLWHPKRLEHRLAEWVLREYRVNE